LAAPTLDHVAILVRDADAAIAYFQAAFGLPLVSDERVAAAGVRLAYLAAGPALLQIVEPIAAGPLRDDLERSGEGLHHLCLATDDIEATVARLAPERRGEIAPGGRGRRTFFLPDPPHGLRIELTERAPSLGPDGSGRMAQPDVETR
jgi:methylmalonyl-CoA/ethylmalonyl-CoA epimerase